MKLRATLKLKHGLIADALSARGWTQADLARACGLGQDPVGRVCNLDFRTIGTKTIERIAEVLGLDEDDILPEALRKKRIMNTFERNFEVKDNLLAAQERLERRLISASPSETVTSSEELSMVTEAALKCPTLTDRQRLVLRLRYGIDVAKTHTYVEIGKMLNLSCERVRQIENNALGRIRQTPEIGKLAMNLAGFGGIEQG